MNEYQNILLKLLKKFIEICEVNSLNYYMNGGSLIGTIRHQGFIPWDDDIDIAMPRNDYEKFIHLKMPEGYGICNYHKDDTWHFAMSRFLDKKKKIDIGLTDTHRKTFAFIDIFPIDGLPDSKIKRYFWIKYILLHRYTIQAIYSGIQSDSIRKRPIWEIALLKIFKNLKLYRFINGNVILQHLEIILKTYDFESTTWCGNMLGRYREREAVRSAWFGKYKYGLFEGVQVRIPEDSDAMLRAVYGDYMIMPDEHSRDTHKISILRQDES